MRNDPFFGHRPYPPDPGLMTRIGRAARAWWNLSAIRRALLRDEAKIDQYNADVDRYNEDA
jgi:hypothetical protein